MCFDPHPTLIQGDEGDRTSLILDIRELLETREGFPNVSIILALGSKRIGGPVSKPMRSFAVFNHPTRRSRVTNEGRWLMLTSARVIVSPAT
ncbi:MAG: hypothetical protein CME26_02870 [Gemmatimonadetes bacterium]|nr:hypothetical protein [Gemmatimonadota bacterium]